jgi:hypothetical protein
MNSIKSVLLLRVLTGLLMLIGGLLGIHPPVEERVARLDS